MASAITLRKFRGHNGLHVLAVLVAGIYIRGWSRRRGRPGAPSAARHAGFFAGLLLIVVALATPIDTLGEHSFAMHQVQHLLLAGLGPLLFMVAAPQSLLLAGTPEPVQRLVGALLESGTARGFSHMFASPTGSVLFFTITLYFWHLPPVHNQAVLDTGTHYAMHVTMLLAGFLFFWRVFDPRPAPVGTTYGVRLAMAWFVTSVGVPLGAYLALKSRPLYSAYDFTGRPWGLSAMQDETLGGLIMWIPGGVVYALALLIVIRLWNAREERTDRWRRRGLPARPEGAAGTGNRSLVLGLTAIVATVFAAVIAVAALNLVVH